MSEDEPTDRLKYFDIWGCFVALREENQKLKAELALATAVCESIDEFDPHGTYWSYDALDAWRRAKEGK